jgi:type I restriction enzyme S subunit
VIGIKGPFVRVPLGALGTWRTGSTPTKNVTAFWSGGTTPWVSPKDFGQAVIDEAVDHVSDAALVRGGARTVPPGSVLVVARSGVLRHTLPVAVAGRELATNQDVRALLPSPGIHPGFVRHQLLAAQSAILTHVVKPGTTVQSLDDARLRAVKMLLPETAEQERIAKALDAMDHRIDEVRRMVDAARRDARKLRDQVLASAWSGELTTGRRDDAADEGRALVRIGDLADRIAYGTAAKSSRSGDVAVLRMGNIREGRLVWDELVFTSNPEEIARHRLLDGDLLFNRTNSPELVGKSAVYHGERPAIAAGYNVVVRCGPRILPDFLAYMINGPNGRAWCRAVRSDGVNQSNISAGKLADFEVPTPPVEEQRETIDVVGRALAAIEEIGRRLDAVDRDCDRLASTVRSAAFETAADERRTPALEAILADVADAIAAHAADEARRRKDMAARRTQVRAVEEIIGERGKDGITFEELLALAETDYETVRASVFGLLSAKPPVLRQWFDPAGRTMRLGTYQP